MQLCASRGDLKEPASAVCCSLCCDLVVCLLWALGLLGPPPARRVVLLAFVLCSFWWLRAGCVSLPYLELVLALPLLPCLCPVTARLLVRWLRSVVALGCYSCFAFGSAVLCHVLLLCCLALRLCLSCSSPYCGALRRCGAPCLGALCPASPPPQSVVRCFMFCCVAVCGGLPCGAGCVLLFFFGVIGAALRHVALVVFCRAVVCWCVLLGVAASCVVWCGVAKRGAMLFLFCPPPPPRRLWGPGLCAVLRLFVWCLGLCSGLFCFLCCAVWC